MINRLFICSYGQIRSVTAANLFKDGNNISLGLYDRYSESMFGMLAGDADEIYIFEDYNNATRMHNTTYFLSKCPETSPKIKHIFHIPDEYGVVNHPELIKRIQKELMGKKLLPD